MSIWIGILIGSIIGLLKLRTKLKEEAIEKENFERSMEEHRKYHEKRCEEMRKKELEEKERAKQQSKDISSNTRYVPSYSFTNDSSYSSVSSGFNYSNGFSNNEFRNKASTPCMSMSSLERQLMVEAEIQSMMDSYLPMNSIYRNSDGSVKQHDYSAFGIAANTPGIDLAEANMFNKFI